MILLFLLINLRVFHEQIRRVILLHFHILLELVFVGKVGNQVLQLAWKHTVLLPLGQFRNVCLRYAWCAG